MTFLHKRAVGDTLSALALQITRDGLPVNLTGLAVVFNMTKLDGTPKVVNAACTISNPPLGYVEYDFTASDVNTAGEYRAYFTAIGGAEPETFPADEDGFQILIYNPNAPEISVPGISDEEFADLVKAPRRTRTVEGTVEERSIEDLIKADRYMKSQGAGVPWGIKIARTKPPGTCS